MNIWKGKPKQVVGNVNDFSEKDFYWNQIPSEEMPKMLQIAQENGWQTALKEYLLPRTDEYTYQYALDQSRGDWKAIFDLSPESVVLDIGCGWGTSTLNLADHFNQVVSIDSTLETLQFVDIRASQEGYSNIEMARTDPLDFGKLPFEDNVFDLIILNGVLEWIGPARDDLDPREVQIFALREINRILKDDGVLYIGIENRFNGGYFFGSKDHSFLPFTSLMPRSIANLFTKAFKKQPYRTYTYSYWGYKDLLYESDLESIEIFYPFPTYRDPSTMIHSEDGNLIKNISDHLNVGNKKYLLKLLSITGLHKVFVHSFSIVAGRGDVKKKLRKFKSK